MCDGREPEERRRLARSVYYDVGMRTENLELKRTRLIRVGGLVPVDGFGRRNRVREESMAESGVACVQTGIKMKDISYTTMTVTVTLLHSLAARGLPREAMGRGSRSLGPFPHHNLGAYCT